MDGTTLLPEAPHLPPTVGNSAVNAIYENLAKTPPGTAWLVATGALTNIALLFCVHPDLADHIAGLSIMGGAIGGFFTHAPMGRLRERVQLVDYLHKAIPSGFSHESGITIKEVLEIFRKMDLLKDAVDMDDDKMHSLLAEARGSFGNMTPFAEFNVRP